MDFDPSEFLAMAMSEDQDAVYTAPDLPHPHESIQIPQSTITVEGGLQMERNMQIPIPTFGMLDLHNEEEAVGEVYDMTSSNGNNSTLQVDEPIHVDMPEPDSIASVAQSSPVERTTSPHTLKKAIPTTYEESRFRKDFFCGNYERVKLFRLHCTICDKHLGCAPWLTERQMRMHKLLNVAVCRKCFDFYGDINFPTEEDSELYCCWCGEGGELFCCSACPKTVCKKCIRRNFGPSKIKEIDENDNWTCFVCKPMDIWPHRALFAGLQRLGKEMRQHVALLSKEERQAKLSKDTSHCCRVTNEDLLPLSLPYKRLMTKIPLCLIAPIHRVKVINQPDPTANFHKNNEVTSPVIYTDTTQPVNQNPFQTIRAVVSTTPPIISPPMPYSNNMIVRRPPQPIFSTVHPSQQMLCRALSNRPAPYPTNRPGTPSTRMSRVQTPQHFQNVGPIRPTTPHITFTSPNWQSSSSVAIDVEAPSFKQPLTKPQIPSYDISWLQKGINDVRETLCPIRMMLDQFDLITSDLKEDISKLTTYSDRLSYNLKITICNLAKINQDIIDSSKHVLDNKVSSVIKDIQSNGLPNHPVTINTAKINESSERIVNSNFSQKPPETAEPQETEEVAPSTGEEDMGDVTPALLCEAVLEVEGNKENENGNKSTLTKKSNITKNQGRSLSTTKIARKSQLVANKTLDKKIEVIDLVNDEDDDDEKKLDISYYLEKFNIKPCTVVLKRIRVRARRSRLKVGIKSKLPVLK